MFKKYAIKLSNTLNTINYLKSTKIHSPTCRRDGYCCCDQQLDSDCGSTSYSSSPIDSDDFNKNLFIENYCIKIVEDVKKPSSAVSAVAEHEEPNNNRKIRKNYSRKLTINRNDLKSEKNSNSKSIEKRRTESTTSSDSSEDDYNRRSNIYQTSPVIYDDDLYATKFRNFIDEDENFSSVLVYFLKNYNSLGFLGCFPTPRTFGHQLSRKLATFVTFTLSNFSSVFFKFFIIFFSFFKNGF